MSLVDTSACQKPIEIKSDDQLVRILQMNIADEESASASYDRQIESITDEHIKEVLTEIRNDEYDHIKKLQSLIEELKPEYAEGTGEEEEEDSSMPNIRMTIMSRRFD